LKAKRKCIIVGLAKMMKVLLPAAAAADPAALAADDVDGEGWADKFSRGDSGPGLLECLASLGLERKDPGNTQ
jgi:hypothetical protein